MSSTTKIRCLVIPVCERAVVTEIIQHDDWEMRLAEYEKAKSKPKKKRNKKAGDCPPAAATPALGM